MRDFLRPSNYSHLIQCPDFRAEPAVDTEHLAVDDGTERHEIEHLTACFPHRGISILLEAFFVESIDLCDLSRFVVPTNQRHAIGISCTKKKKQYMSASAAYSNQYRKKNTYFAFRHKSNVKVSKLK